MPCLVRVSEATSLALHTMAFLAGNLDQRFTNRAIAQGLGASVHHLAKVMQQLAKADLVQSQRGPLGGFRLNVDAAKIQLLRIYEAVEGPITREGCGLHKTSCDGNKCLLGNLMDSFHEQIRDCLENTTLADFSANFGLQDTTTGKKIARRLRIKREEDET
jgi:Rrf2 family transcriptional regulator, nitric oxide-sensitive transcriptional repressor